MLELCRGRNPGTAPVSRLRRRNCPAGGYVSRVITDEQRRARLGVRHGLATRVGSALEAARAVVCLHATEPATPYLSVWARTGLGRAAFDQAMYTDRELVKQLAMRRTLFVFPREVMPAVWGSASARVADQIGPRLAREIERCGLAEDGGAWLNRQDEAVRSALRQQPMTTADLRAAVPELDQRMVLSPGKPYEAEVAVANQAITVLAATGRIQRGANRGTWRSSRPEWTTDDDWLGGPATPLHPEEGYRHLIGAWLRQFGPGTEDDIVWWLGATKSVVRRALADLRAVEVQTGVGPAFVLPDDVVDPSDDLPEPWAALLPVLDATTMGWKHRDWYLGDHAGQLFDGNGNAGTTAWWNGRVVGGWHQDPDGVVVVDLLEDVGADATAQLTDRAVELTDWLAGEIVGTLYPSPLSRAHRS